MELRKKIIYWALLAGMFLFLIAIKAGGIAPEEPQQDFTLSLVTICATLVFIPLSFVVHRFIPRYGKWVASVKGLDPPTEQQIDLSTCLVRWALLVGVGLFNLDIHLLLGDDTTLMLFAMAVVAMLLSRPMSKKTKETE